jgi:transcriptional regulator with XRE-family HTH domain
MTLVANNIKYLRRMNGLTQEQFARKIGIKRSLLGAYEEGRANPNLDNLMNIAKIFGTTVDNLLKNDIRRLRESQGIPIPQPAPHLQARSEPEAPKPLASIIDKYYRQPVAQTPPPAELRPAVQAETLTLERNQPNLFRHPAPEPVVPLAPAPAAKQQAGSMEWVSRGVAGDYLARYAYPDFLKGLPQLSLPGLPAGKYRAFQAEGDFPVEGATVVGAYVNNWYDIRDGGHYLVVVHKQGILYRRLYNQVKTKGSLLLLSDMPGIPPFEVSIKDVLEIWESKAFVSYQMPEPRPATPLDGLSVLVQEMQRELERLQK